VDDLPAVNSKDVGLIVHAISFQDFHLCGPDLQTSQMDRQTDDMRSQDCTLHYSASCGNYPSKFPESAEKRSTQIW